MKSLDLPDFLKAPGVILDVRSPGEYAHARIPHAINLPLFDDAERASVGTVYKQTGRQAAIELGLKFTGPKLSTMAATAKMHAPDGFTKVHCWRGGMRSSSMAWLLNMVGLKTVTLKGGYKAYRKWALSSFSQRYKFIVIGGLTGSGKTDILHELQRYEQQVLDLEDLASHRGSSYGMLGMPCQPSSELFENEIAFKLNSLDPAKPIWLEDESRMIGRCKIPDDFYNSMRKAPLLIIDRPKSERIARLIDEYACLSPQLLIEATERLSRRLGGARTQEIIHNIHAEDFSKAIEISLQYYDSTYHYGLSQRNQPVFQISREELNANQWAQILISKAKGEKYV